MAERPTFGEKQQGVSTNVPENLKLTYQNANELRSIAIDHADRIEANETNIQAATSGEKPFQSLTDADTFYTANPPAEDALFVVSSIDTVNAGHWKRLSATNTNQFERAFVDATNFTSKTTFDTYTENVNQNIYSTYKIVGANSVLPSAITIGATGDYVEFVCVVDSFGTTSLPTGMGIIGERGATAANSNIGYWENGFLYIRADSGEFITTDGLNGLAITEGVEHRLKIEYTATAVLIILNGATINTIVTTNSGDPAIDEDIKLLDIGNAYRVTGLSFDGKLRDFTISQGGTVTKIPSPILDETITNTDVGEEISPSGLLTKEQNAALSQVSNNAECYYEYNPTGHLGAYGKFTIYQRYKNYPNQYIGIYVVRYFDDAKFSDNWRIAGAREYSLTNGVMSDSGVEVMNDVENEFTYQTSGSSDFTGGWHGDEKVLNGNIKFFANGVEIDITGALSLTACQIFEYRQESQMFTTDDAAHPVEAVHIKRTKFLNAGYHTVNDLLTSVATDITTMYTGISCVGVINSTGADAIGTENLNYYTPVRDDSFQFNLNDGEREIFFSNTVGGYSAYATSTILIPSIEDETALLRIRDRTDDSKYYRSISPGANIANKRFLCEMTVTFDKI